MRLLLVGLAIAGTALVPAAAAHADNAAGQAASPSTTVVTKTVDVTNKVPVTSLATQTSQVTVTSVKEADDTDDDDDSDKTGLWGLLGLLGLAGLAGLRRRPTDDTTRRGTVGPQAGATGTRQP